MISLITFYTLLQEVKQHSRGLRYTNVAQLSLLNRVLQNWKCHKFESDDFYLPTTARARGWRVAFAHRGIGDHWFLLYLLKAGMSPVSNQTAETLFFNYFMYIKEEA